MLRYPVRILAAGAWLAVAAPMLAAQAQTGAIRVEVTDSSGARLPGVAVAATGTDGKVVNAVTDRSGGARFPSIAVGPAMLRLRREGFTGAIVGVTVQAGVETPVTQQLEVAPLAETVVVSAPAPVEPVERRPPPPPAPVAPRGPLVKPVPPHDRDSVCGPSKPGLSTGSLGTIRSSRYVAEGGQYTTGGQIAIDGGSVNGLEVGQNLVVRRYFRVERSGGATQTAEHSAGLIQLVSVSERSSIAVAIYACDGMRAGDFLAAFRPEPIRPPEPPGTPDYGDPARILFADEGQTLAVPRRMMVIDRGSDRGIRVGQRLTLFHRRDGRGPTVAGDAIVVATRLDSATIRVERVSDMISSGDLAAPQIVEPAAGR